MTFNIFYYNKVTYQLYLYMKNLVNIFIAFFFGFYFLNASVLASSSDMSASILGSAVAQYVPNKASNVKVGTIKVTTNQDTQFSGIILSRSWLWYISDITDLRLAQNWKILPSKVFLWSDDKFYIQLESSLQIKKYMIYDFDVLVSLDAAHFPPSQHTFTMDGFVKEGNCYEDINPITLGLLNTKSYRVSRLWVYEYNEVRQGDEIKQKIALKSYDKDINVRSIRLKSSWNLNENFSEFILYKDGLKISDGATLASHYMQFSNLDLHLDWGKKAEIELVAKIKTEENIVENNFFIEDSSDIGATESATWYPSSVHISDTELKDSSEDLDRFKKEYVFPKKDFKVCEKSEQNNPTPPNNTPINTNTPSSPSNPIVNPPTYSHKSSSGPGGWFNRVMWLMAGWMPKEIKLSETGKIIDPVAFESEKKYQDIMWKFMSLDTNQIKLFERILWEITRPKNICLLDC